ncbi:MAG: hypothetical protein KAT15_06380, partial [Bacteroidales bacterium]|nr:hypothetical protein [Bacteroidales bacterium]
MNVKSFCFLILFLAFTGIAGTAQQKSPLTDGEVRLELHKKHQELYKSSAMKDAHWQHLGPTNISGRVTDVEAVRPRGESYTIYAALCSGGVWKTLNEGLTWDPIFENEVTVSIGDIAVDPGNPDKLWVGTGEANILRRSYAGSGIYLTRDGGESWENMGLAGTNTIARIVIDPGNTDVLYVAATGNEWTANKERGVYKTINGGETWEKVLYIDKNTGANDIVMDPGDPNILYASTWERV